jgi:DtxR family transcriptional regulator, Mn-dependent transcriptional regulator
MATEKIEEYLEAIGRLEERGDRATTSSLARALHVSAPSVTEMLGRLTERGLTAYRPRGEIALTDDGRTMARSVMRRHRLWERFLHDVLGIRLDSVHGEACRLEHATSPLVESELARAVGDSSTCPHGQAIPGLDGAIVHEPSIPLLDLEFSRASRVVSIDEEDPNLLRNLEELGIEPGVAIEITSLDLAAGIAIIRIGEASTAVPIGVVNAIRVASEKPENGLAALPLAQLVAGQTGLVDRSSSSRRLAARCLALGFTPGTPITVIHNRKNGPVIVQVRDTRVALGRGEAQKIQVIIRDPTDGADGESL